MPIEIGAPSARKGFGWFGDTIPGDVLEVFRQREYAGRLCSDADLRAPDILAGLSAVIFNQTESKPLAISRSIEQHGARLLDNNCAVVVRMVKTGVAIVENTLERLQLPYAGLPKEGAGSTQSEPPTPYVRCTDATVDWNYVANMVQEMGATPAPNLALKIDAKKAIDAEVETLIRRAFWDCANVTLKNLPGARSGANVLRAFADSYGRLGEWMQPFFVKVGERQEILDEYKVYKTMVHSYVPFHLGPHLDYMRSCLGATKGLLVGNYVSESESLLQCACDGRSTAALACLFDRTMLGWHRQGKEVDVPFCEPLLAMFPRQIEAGRSDYARKLGANLGIADLRALFEKCRSRPVLVGPTHGDLHANNVRVRGTDAIIIDMGSHLTNPLLLDAATLEASLLVEGSADGLESAEWFEILKPLYDRELLRCAAPQVAANNACSWFYSNVRQIRGYARQWECGNNQYAAALGLALLQKAKKDTGAPEPEAFRRAAAYVFAELVLRNAFG